MILLRPSFLVPLRDLLICRPPRDIQSTYPSTYPSTKGVIPDVIDEFCFAISEHTRTNLKYTSALHSILAAIA